MELIKTNKEMTDNIVNQVLKKYKERSQVGIKKYGVTLEREDLNTLQWLKHAQEEAMDLSLYLERLIQDENNRINEIRVR